MFVVLQIKCQGKVLKAWYGCLFPESSIDLYPHYSTGQHKKSAHLQETNNIGLSFHDCVDIFQS